MTPNFWLYVALPGLLGGVVLFLYGVRNGSYRNNKYKIKLAIELIGASVTASCLGLLLEAGRNGEVQVAPFAFAIGLCWASLIQTVRKRITKIIEGVLE